MAFERVGVRAVVEGLGAFNRGIKQIEKGFGAAGDAAKEAQKETENLNKVLKTVGIGMVAAAGASGAFIFSATKLAARVETLGVVTKRLGENVGATEEEIRDLEASIKAQGITLQATRKSIALMIQSQIDLAKGTELARLAQNAAVIANVDSSEAFQRLVFVITSGNIRMARTLGLQVSFQESYKKMAEEIGVATTALTQQQKVQARTSAVLAAGTTITGAYEESMTTAGKKVLSLNRHIEDSTRLFGDAFLPIYSSIVDLITASLKSWQALDVGLQKSIAQTVGMVTAVGGLTGTLALLFPKLKAVGPALDAINVKLGTTTLALGAATAGVTIIIAALVMLFQTQRRIAETTKELEGELNKFEDELFETSETWEEYAKEANRVNALMAEQAGIVRVLVGEFEFLDEAGFEAAKEQDALAAAAVQSDEKLIRLATDMKNLTDEEFQAARAAERLAERQAHAAAVAEDWAFVLERNAEKVQELNTLLGLNLTDNVEDFQESIGDLNDELADLETERLAELEDLELGGAEDVQRARERIGDLRDDLELALLKQEEANDRAAESDKERSESSIVAENNRIQAIRDNIREQEQIIAQSGDVQAAALAELDAEFAEKEASIRAQIDETKEAFSEQTKRFIFDLAQQRFAIGGFTREELKVLNRLAGPEGLGLLDEASLALLGKIDEVAEGLELEGDQSQKAGDDIVDFTQTVLDATIAQEDLIDALERTPSRVEIEVAMRTVELPARRLRPAGTTVTISPSDINDVITSTIGGPIRQFGGKLQKGQPGIIGESGRELFIPGQTGMVMPNRFVKSMESLFRAAAPVAAAGAAGGGVSTTSNTEMNLNIETVSDPEPIVQDFEMMRALADRRR